jgi:gliding motility-associated protein GldL
MKKAKGILRAIQAFMDSARGKTLLNYFYSWGAAIVILGTLFKLTHLPGANIMLFVGMGTEVIVFFFSAFERAYDVIEDEKKEEFLEETLANGTAFAGQPIIIGAPAVSGAAVASGTTSMPANATGEVATGNSGSGTIIIGGGGAVGAQPMSPETAEKMGDVTEEYVEQVRLLNEAIQRIAQQSESLGHNLEEMDILSRNLTGMNAVYEIQLRNASGHLDAVSQVNEQTKKMAKQIEELNNIYARMIEAMTTTMQRPQI